MKWNLCTKYQTIRGITYFVRSLHFFITWPILQYGEEEGAFCVYNPRWWLCFWSGTVTCKGLAKCQRYSCSNFMGQIAIMWRKYFTQGVSAAWQCANMVEYAELQYNLTNKQAVMQRNPSYYIICQFVNEQHHTKHGCLRQQPVDFRGIGG